jgi:geranylgeranyl pyrophosphate synthase
MSELASQVGADLAGLARFLGNLEKVLGEQSGDDPTLRRYGDSALMKGLRVRPVLVYLGYNLLNEEPTSHDTLVSLAAALELVHKASVIMDDFIDCDDQRRGAPTFHTEHGFAATMLFSTWLVARANHLIFGVAESSGLSRSDASVLVRYYDTLGNALTRGALQELAASEGPTSVRDCLRVISRQSATLIGTCLAGGFVVSGRASDVSRGQIEALGHQIGIVYQVLNDLKAFTTAADQGRLISSDHWSDIVMNRKNLVVSLAYSRMEHDERSHWHECRAAYGHDPYVVTRLVAMIEQTGAVEATESWLRRQRGIVAARAAQLPSTPARNILLAALATQDDRSLFSGQTFKDLIGRLRIADGPGPA